MMSARKVAKLMNLSLNTDKNNRCDWWGWLISIGYFCSFYKRIKNNKANYSEYLLALMVLFTLNTE